MLNYFSLYLKMPICPRIPKQTVGRYARLLNGFTAVLFPLIATFLAGCVTVSSPVLLPNDQTSMISEIASARQDGGPREPITKIRAFSPDEKTPNVKILMVDILVDTEWRGIPFVGAYKADPKKRAESECLRIINNFRKAGLPAGFSGLAVASLLPLDMTNPNIEVFGNTVSDDYFCAYYIDRKELMNGSPPIQAVKEFKILNNKAVPSCLNWKYRMRGKWGAY